MLSIGRLSGPDSERYYLDKIARGREDYYAGRGEMPGEWAGSGIDLLMESDGEISGEQFTAILQGKSPATGEALGQASERSVHGFDLTFSAPKTVSLLYGLGDAAVANAARRAHDEAVRQALGYLERQACWARQGKGGREHVRGAGFLAAGFRHRTSRAGDPALHTHLVVANVTQRPDGSWASLDSRQLYRYAKTAGYLYQASLRADLAASLGVEWEVPHNGLAEVAGVPREVIDHFSQRRAQIVDYMAERGETSRQAASVAALQTRAPKDQVATIDDLRADWRARGSEHGFTAVELGHLLDRPERFERESLEAARIAVDSLLPELTEQASTFDRRDVLRAWAERHRRGASVDDLERLADHWLGSDRAIPVEPDDRPHIPRRYSTPEMIELERQLIDDSRQRQGADVAAAPRPMTDEVIRDRPELGDEQRDLVRALTTSGDGVQVVRAAAGTGKTYALDAAREVWQRSGHSVIGCALSARAAVELREQTAIPSHTIAKLQHDLRRGHRLPDKGVLIVDEAGMVGTRTIAELAEHAKLAGSKLVLCGDDRQLPEIEAGGVLRGLAKRLGAVELHEVRRQRHDWDRDALRALREGRLDTWAEAYRAHGRIVTGHDAHSTRAQLVDDWYRSTDANPDEDLIMLAHRRADVAELNQLARARLRAAGKLEDLELQVTDRAFAVGDRVVTTRNEPRNEIVNGERGRIVAIDSQAAVVDVGFDSGRTTQLPAAYVADGHLDHAYAMTAHRAQGATVDRAFVLGSDDVYREWGYTALSRHREEARYYVNLGHDAQLPLPGLDIARDRPADPVTGPLRERRAKHLALDSTRAGSTKVEVDVSSYRDVHEPSERQRADAVAALTDTRRVRSGAAESRDRCAGDLSRSRDVANDGPTENQREAARAALDEHPQSRPEPPEPQLDLELGIDIGPDPWS